MRRTRPLPFVVGRLARDGHRLLFPRPASAPAPFPGPWELRAVIVAPAVAARRG